MVATSMIHTSFDLYFHVKFQLKNFGFLRKNSPGPGALNATSAKIHQNSEKPENRTTTLREKSCIIEKEVSFLHRFLLKTSLESQ